MIHVCIPLRQPQRQTQSPDFIRDMADSLVSEFKGPHVSPYLIADACAEMARVLNMAPCTERADAVEDLTIKDLIDTAMLRKARQVAGVQP